MKWREREEKRQKTGEINGRVRWYFSLVFLLNGSSRASVCTALIKSSTQCLILWP